MITDWSDAYEIRGHIENAQGYFDAWARDADALRSALGDAARLDLPYGDGPRRRFDLFFPEAHSRGLCVFVHGGYWLAFDKSHSSHLARGALEAGWAVAVPSYTLAPEARITEITGDIGSAIEAAAAEVAGPIRLAGHSAGGHLVTRMVCTDSPLTEATRERIAHVLSISGVHDLRPLLATRMNDTLGLDAAEARRESPALADPWPGTAVTAWVGDRERPEFLRQTDLLANAWSLPGMKVRAHHDPGRHHFDVVAPLTERTSPLTRAFTGEDGWA